MLQRLVVLTLIAFCFAVPDAIAQDEKKSKPEVWMGTLDAGVAKLRLKITVTEKDGKKTATLESLDQGKAKIPMDSFTVKDGVVKFALEKLTIKYEGKLNEKKTVIEGTFEQGGRELKLDLKKIDGFQPDKHVETWKGTMDAGARKFDFQIRIFDTYQGKTGKLDSFSESMMGLPIELTIKDKQFDFDLKLTGAKYVGKLSDNKKTVKGKWKQRGNELDLEFKKIHLSQTRDPKAKRPQNPKEPFPYASKKITFKNEKDKITLAGTLTIPKGEGPFPAVILISGSGGQDRDETLFNHRPFWVIADRMSRAGIAVLRYDERGIGESTGDFSKANSVDLSRDIEAGVEFLKSREEIDKSKIGLIGHSEGGYLGPMVAARNKSIAFVVCMAGPGVPGKDIIINQTELMMKATGESDKEIKYALGMSRALIKTVEANPSLDEKALIKKLEQTMDEYLAANKPTKFFEKNLEAAKAGLSQMASPWFRFFLFHDPRVDLRKVTVPVLAFCGTKDLQVDADLNLPEIEKALKEAGNKDVTIKKVEGLNHLFQKTKTGRIDEYGFLEETFNEDLLKMMVNWVVKKTK